jgi:hypothetical protein
MAGKLQNGDNGRDFLILPDEFLLYDRFHRHYRPRYEQ